MPVISAAGRTASPLFVFKCITLPFRTVLWNGKEYVKTFADLLPRGTIITVRSDVAGVDSQNFLNWAYIFVDEVRDLAANGRKLLLI